MNEGRAFWGTVLRKLTIKKCRNYQPSLIKLLLILILDKNPYRQDCRQKQMNKLMTELHIFVIYYTDNKYITHFMGPVKKGLNIILIRITIGGI